MKKIALYLFIICIIVSGCGTYAAQGALTGSQVGATLGSAIGGLSDGWRGSNKGTIAGMIGGAVVGGAIGKACDKSKENKQAQRYEDNRDRMYMRSEKSNNGSTLSSSNVFAAEMRNIIFYDQNDNGSLSSGEQAKIEFEIYNNGYDILHNVKPAVELTSRTKHIEISEYSIINQIGPGESVKYTVYIKTGSKLKNGKAKFRISIYDSINRLLAPRTEFEVETNR